MLTSRYLTSNKNLAAIMARVVDGTAPPKFTQVHLKSIGFKSSNDFGVIGLLKDLKFLSEDGTPTQRYHDTSVRLMTSGPLRTSFLAKGCAEFWPAAI